ncbi:unnamed protein product, partial [Ectocarpus sp. 12 AP-2014]
RTSALDTTGDTPSSAFTRKQHHQLPSLEPTQVSRSPVGTRVPVRRTRSLAWLIILRTRSYYLERRGHQLARTAAEDGP